MMNNKSVNHYKRNRNVVYSCQYHVIWCPKHRKHILKGSLEKTFKEIIQSLADKARCDIIEMEVMPDHFHLLIEVDPQFGMYQFVRMTKGRSSRELRQRYPSLMGMKNLWTNSYFVSTVGGAPLEVIKQYVENQKLA